MLNAISGLGNWLLGRRRVRIIMLGADGSGKTTLLYRMKLQETVTTIPTIGFNVETVEYFNTKFDIWDLGGCDRLRFQFYHYITPECLVFFLHDMAETEERTDFSIEVLHDHVKQMLGQGCRNIWILLNKKDRIPIAEQPQKVAALRDLFNSEMKQYGDQISYRIKDLPSSGVADCLEVLDDVVNALRNRQIYIGKTNDNAGGGESQMNNNQKNDESSLLKRIRTEGASDMSADVFWQSFLDASLPKWDHRSHLRAGYMVLLETFQKMEGIFTAADHFLSHLERLRGVKPERFRNTEHRTMTIFWLLQLQIAILDYRASQRTQELPKPSEFQDILLHKPSLMNGQLWNQYYSKDLMFSPEAKQYWRLPDLQALPNFKMIYDWQKAQPSRISQSKTQEDPDRLIRFAFAVVQKYMASSNLRRGWIVKQALSSLQSLTIRLRAKNASVPAYSETQAYFWIQMVHAALRSIEVSSTSPKGGLAISLSHLTFPSFKTLFSLFPTAWRAYYTPKTWDSITARMSFVNPDLKPLPSVISIPSHTSISEALRGQLDTTLFSMAPEMPSMEDLAFRAALVVAEAKEMRGLASEGKEEGGEGVVQVRNHVELLVLLYERLVQGLGKEEGHGQGLAKRAADVLMDMSGPYVESFTQKTFWTQQVLTAAMRVRENEDVTSDEKEMPSTDPAIFDDFIKTNLHLVYEDLPMVYYSQELWRSVEAKKVFMAPDRRKMKGFVTEEIAAADDEFNDKDEYIFL